DGHADQALGSGDGDGLDTDTGIRSDSLARALQHVVVQEINELLRFRRAFLPLHPGIHVFCVLAKDHDIHALRMLYRRGHTLVVAHRAHTGIQIEDLPQGDVQRADAAADRSRQRSLDGDAKGANGIHGIVRQPRFEFAESFFAGEDLVPDYATPAAIAFIYGSIEDAPRSSPDIAAGAVSLDVRNDRIFRNDKRLVVVSDPGAIRRH